MLRWLYWAIGTPTSGRRGGHSGIKNFNSRYMVTVVNDQIKQERELTTDTLLRTFGSHLHQSSNPQVHPSLTRSRILPLQPPPDTQLEHVPMFAAVAAAALADDTPQFYQEFPYSSG
jgi:hypothetical protein